MLSTAARTREFHGEHTVSVLTLDFPDACLRDSCAQVALEISPEDLVTTHSPGLLSVEDRQGFVSQIFLCR